MCFINVCLCLWVRSLNEVIRVVGIGFKSLGFLLHAFLDFQDGGRLRLILQGTKNKPEWLFYITICPLRKRKKKLKKIWTFLTGVTSPWWTIKMDPQKKCFFSHWIKIKIEREKHPGGQGLCSPFIVARILCGCVQGALFPFCMCIVTGCFVTTNTESPSPKYDNYGEWKVSVSREGEDHWSER